MSICVYENAPDEIITIARKELRDKLLYETQGKFESEKKIKRWKEYERKREEILNMASKYISARSWLKTSWREHFIEIVLGGTYEDALFTPKEILLLDDINCSIPRDIHQMWRENIFE